ncbi:WecB/TagA/CpsF family glycosyltransferase [Pseudarthrobacter niigatensis]|uniref:Exopolysaccharide biosynthesis WecB/TagA/CpsF family protein n=1 Tax=Pseudarthrobacter niigatensis TaxID=369935 RepID=A0AAJ1SX18_9MICC|nr:WecB/TagA/CpsF family glycosyltransferase [Pseudarthrobacter niigatensis]MDQ0147744.1 exopolysaccharide biosynthesis WecB/TagA/CpsF family protein [Pseudarthrobacter niigatensis]MDQ0267625.1 exopolysaccharide biosynthesis WecB/TagA/CpsF family protein [Pseudarthrobacter niigatensis]
MGRASGAGSVPLCVLSANLDHLNHFGVGGRWEGSLDVAPLEWLTLLDGAPLVSRAGELTGRHWPRLAGSDLIDQILATAADLGLSVGFLGGSAEAQRRAGARLKAQEPFLKVAGWWAPGREVLADRRGSLQLCSEIRAAGANILLVCLGKPRQELWIAEYGHLTGANVLLAFGAVVDFLAGNVQRAPAQVSSMGLEWAWRLAIEPRRLAKRYLLEGPESYVRLRRHSTALVPAVPAASQTSADAITRSFRPRGFTPVSEYADVAALVVTYNNGSDVCGMLESLLQETTEQSIKVVVADNSPNPETLVCLQHYPEVTAFATGGNLGYAGGINAARARAGTADAYLVLNPDLRLHPGSVRALRASMGRTGAGVVVPLLRNEDGTLYPSLRREPSILRALGDAALGSRLPGRPGWLSEMDFDAESYAHPHRVEWATGAALLIRADVADEVGEWDETYFLYSEETDYLHRVRELGAAIWFEPVAAMTHGRGGSGSSPALDALVSANRIRYARKFHTLGYARVFRAAVVLSALLRAPLPAHRGILGLVARETRWAELPHAVTYKPSRGVTEDPPAAAVIIPAHNEASVLGRTLAALKLPLATGQVEVIVACNGCTDATSGIAAAVPGVRVIDVPVASKVAALNAADEAAVRWPRVYVDADIEVPPEALYATLKALSADNGVLCARPAFAYDTSGASWAVRAYYRARSRLPQSSASMWGAGVYGLSQEGHERLGEFPSLTADDCYIDRLFSDSEKVVVECTPVTVRTPRSARVLLSTLCRVYRGNTELRGMDGAHTGKTLRELAASIKGPATALDALVYAAFAVSGRLPRRRRSMSAWERDQSSREGSQG